MNRIVRSYSFGTIVIVAAMVTGCGGGGGSGTNNGGNGAGNATSVAAQSSSGAASSAPTAAPDFNITATTVVNVVQGDTSSPITLAISALNGFNRTVSVNISGLPAGATTNPAFPLTLSAGAPQQFTVTVPTTATTGNLTISLSGTSGSVAHNTSFALNISPAIQTAQSGGILYLQSHANGHTVRIGLNTAWGGSIVEANLDGVNFVNAHDTGREVQPAFYDGAGSYTASKWEWDPVLGGDRYNHGSPVLSASLTDNSIYVKTQPLEWNPDYKGGGSTTPVPSDTIVEQTVSIDPAAPLAFKIHFVITHKGSDLHFNAQQELPAVYVNSQYGNFYYYGGTKPWTDDPITHLTPIPPSPGTGALYAPEQWSALTDANGQGLTIFTPNQYPYVMANANPSNGSGPTGDANFYMRPFTLFTFGPGSVLQEDIYLIPGDVQAARATVRQLHQKLTPINIFSPMGNIDTPAANAIVSGNNVTVSGWAFGNVPVAAIQILIDGVARATPSLTLDRSDVATAYPYAAPLKSGWSFNFDSTTLSNGTHSITARIVDSAGNTAILAPTYFAVNN